MSERKPTQPHRGPDRPYTKEQIYRAVAYLNGGSVEPDQRETAAGRIRKNARRQVAREATSPVAFAPILMSEKFWDGIPALEGRRPTKPRPTGHPPGSFGDRWAQLKRKPAESYLSPFEPTKILEDVPPPIDWPRYQAQRGKPLPPFVFQGQTERERQFIKEVASQEGSDENKVFGDGKFITPESHAKKPLSGMTIEEVVEYMPLLRAETKAAGYGKDSGGTVRGTSAVGTGQVVEGTLRRNLDDLGIRENDFGNVSYDKGLQEILLLNIANGVGLDPNQADKWGAREKARLAGQWESLDVGKGKISEEELDALLDRITAQSPMRPVQESSKPMPRSQRRRPKPNLRLPWQPQGPVKGGGGGGGW